MNIESTHPIIYSAHDTILTPGHHPRRETPEYSRSHHTLIDVLDTPCYICDSRKSTGADMETHHLLEWSLQGAMDWRKVSQDHGSIASQSDFDSYIDSPANLMPLCVLHHTGQDGIHRLPYPVWFAQKYLRAGYILVEPSGDNLVGDEAKDDTIEKEGEPGGPPSMSPPSTLPSPS